MKFAIRPSSVRWWLAEAASVAQHRQSPAGMPPEPQIKLKTVTSQPPRRRESWLEYPSSRLHQLLRSACRAPSRPSVITDGGGAGGAGGAGRAGRAAGGAPPLVRRALRPRPRLKKSSGKKRVSRVSVSRTRSWADARSGETARPSTGGRGRAMPALALRDQPLDCSMRLRDLPAWPPPRPHNHGQ
ncbi:unnamed protein product [Chilo suppressalis]|uniref:Uncharacterized protein n=1 Tax=Chilo suppressalis TaxID=168631 RepID=A0ABN8BF15_CHISP|nr:unnamed protein product [Chilo suppressalis]